MEIKFKPMGPYETNCYLLIQNDETLIIDPGVGATNWVLENAVNPLAIINTHGHFDHVWSNAELKQKLNIPIYIPQDDAPALEGDMFQAGLQTTTIDTAVQGDEKFSIGSFNFQYFYAPGHTPGCSAVVFDDDIFSGDFIFARSIGRTDFPYANPKNMQKSLQRFIEKFENGKEMTIHPGHYGTTTTKKMMNFLPSFVKSL